MTGMSCPCCGRDATPDWEFEIRPLRLYRSWRPDSQRPGGSLPLCGACAEWLGNLAAAARTPDGVQAVIGGPNSGQRKLVFEDQCQVCFEMPSGRAAKVAWVSPTGERLQVFVCAGCEAWLTALASDGRTIRGASDRENDGPYGQWPHPNLRGLHVRFDIEDHSTRAVVSETCSAMGMVVTADSADILLTQATTGGRATRAMKNRKGLDIAVIVLAPMRARRDLAEALQAGARAWTTVPVTPQQLTSALSRASRGEDGRWDLDTCLPLIDPAKLDRPAVACKPNSDTEVFELVWLLKRFSRGYDELAWHNGSVLVVPRAPTDLVANIATRLAVLIDGRCEFSIVHPRNIPTAVRFEAAG